MPSTKMIRTSQAARAVTIVLSGTAAALYGVLVSMKSQHPNANIAWNCLPLFGVGFSAFWSFLSLMTLCSGTVFFFPRRLHLCLDLFVGISMLVLGYLSLVFNTIVSQQRLHHHHHHHHSRRHYQMEHMQAAGVALLSVAAFTHMVFFCYNSKKSLREESIAEAAPPAYNTGAGNPFEDAQSVRSLPQYEVGEFEEVDIEKKERSVFVSEQEVESAV